MGFTVDSPGDAPERKRFSDYAGCVVLLAVGGIHEQMSVASRMVDAARVHLAVLSGPEAGTWEPDFMIFNQRPVGRLVEKVGRPVIGIVTQESGKNGAVDLEPVGADWATYAQTWVDAHEAEVAQHLALAVREYQRAELNREDLPRQAQRTPTVPTSGPTVPQAPPNAGPPVGNAWAPVPPPNQPPPVQPSPDPWAPQAPPPNQAVPVPVTAASAPPAPSAPPALVPPVSAPTAQVNTPPVPASVPPAHWSTTEEPPF